MGSAIGAAAQWAASSAISAARASDFTSIYFPGPDNIAHYEGVGRDPQGNPTFPAGGQDVTKALDVTGEHFEEYTDFHFGKVLDRIVELGYARATVFVIASDHGMVGVDISAGGGFDSRKIYQSVERTDELDNLLRNVTLHSTLFKSGDVAGYRVVYSPNGGLAHIYLRDIDKEWDERPDYDQTVKRYATELYEAAAKPGSVWLPTFYKALGDPTAPWNEKLAILVRDEDDGSYGVFECVDFVTEPVIHDLSVLDQDRSHWESFASRIRDLDDGNAASRAGDIILLFNVRDGFNSSNQGDVWPGWHGGATMAESYVPFWVASFASEGLETTFIDDILDDPNFIGQAQPRLSHIGPLVQRLFERAGR
ncbi:MAG: alkaline phosphatase family protein [Planctomycetota bacterium]